MPDIKVISAEKAQQENAAELRRIHETRSQALNDALEQMDIDFDIERIEGQDEAAVIGAYKAGQGSELERIIAEAAAKVRKK